MAKALVIAEKPSLGRSIVSAISWWKNEKFTRQGKDRNTWLESDNYIVASSVGHLYELIDLDAYFPDYDPEKKHPWTMDRLPFFPDDWNFRFEGKDNVKGLIRTLDSLMNRKDVDVIYNAGDPDREGQRLVDEIIEHGLKTQKTIYRLWLPDTTNKTIKQAFETAKPNKNYTAFSSSAETRSEMDWLLGIELTRYASIKAQGFIRIGRCVCPIVQHVIEREKAIKEFVPKPYSAVTSKEKTNEEVIELTSKRTFEEGHEEEAQALAAKEAEEARKAEEDRRLAERQREELRRQEEARRDDEPEYEDEEDHYEKDEYEPEDDYARGGYRDDYKDDYKDSYKDEREDDEYSNYPEDEPEEKPSKKSGDMDVEEFVQYACKYASEIDCSISGKSMLALYERAEMMEEDGEPLTKTSAEDLIEEAADKAEKKSFSGLFSSKYDKDGLLILKEKHFFD